MTWFQSLSALVRILLIHWEFPQLVPRNRIGGRSSQIMSVFMKFLHLHLFHKEFGNIERYDDLKDIVRRALDAEDNYNLLFIGAPAAILMLTEPPW